MLIETIKVGSLQTNCYLAADGSGQCVIIDPGDEAHKIIQKVQQEKLRPLYIINTHLHPDHVGADQTLKKHFSVPVCMGSMEKKFLRPLFGYFGLSEFEPDRWLEEGEKIKCGALEFEVLSTPGHSPGGICLYLEKERALFSGDTLFDYDVGRFDLPGGSEEDLKSSVREKLFVLPDEVVVYPGHGGKTTLKKSKEILKEYLYD